MARDYRNNGNRSRGGRQGAGRKGGMFTGLMLGIVLGLLAAVALAWYFYATPSTYKATAIAPKPPPAAPVQPSVAPPVESVGDKPAGGVASSPYTFYDILPGNQAPRPLEPPTVAEVWWLQVAALKNPRDADALRAQLLLLNLTAVVQKTQGSDTSLYRVRVGPFTSKAMAESARETLVANNFEPRLLKEAVIP